VCYGCLPKSWRFPQTRARFATNRARSVTIASTPSEAAPSRWGPFSHLAFTVIWSVSVFSNVGTAMFDTASGWLITSIDPNPMMVSLVQVAVSLPLFLFTLPAGALADVLDSRRLLIAVETAILAVSVIFAGLVSIGLATPTLLLATTFLLGVGGALTSPAWGATLPMLVPKEDLDGAIAANGAGFNIGRAAGPALGGLVIAWSGISVPFWVFAATNVAIIAALLWWRSPRRGGGSLPAERLLNAVRTGARHAANNPDLRATLVRVVTFFPFAIAYLALLPLVARAQMADGPQFYGVLLGAIGVGTVGGTLALTRLKIGADSLAAIGAVGMAAALVIFGVSHEPISAISACLLAGASWTVVLTKLYVSAQVALPDWARGRGLAVFLTFIFGATTAGSAIWGKLTELQGLQNTYFVAAAGLLIGIPLTWRWKLQTGAALDLSPALHWRAPTPVRKVQNNQGPVLVVVEYRVAAENRAHFQGALDDVGHARKRDGAYAWGVYENIDDIGRFTETFLMDSWLELLHERERRTNADESMLQALRELLVEPPRVTFSIATDRPHRHSQRGRGNDQSRRTGEQA
jgi:MFS family permease